MAFDFRGEDAIDARNVAVENAIITLQDDALNIVN